MSKRHTSDPRDTIRLVTKNNLVVCVIIPAPLTKSQMRLVRCIFYEFPNYPKLVTKWRVWGVLANESWVESQNDKGLLATEPPSSELQFTAADLPHVGGTT